MKNIIMPKLSDTMIEGLLGSWLKNVGDPISRGDIIAEVETDKATMGLEAFDDGILLEQRVRSGESVPVGTVLGVMGKPGELPVREPDGEVPAEPVEQIPPDVPTAETEPPGATEVLLREKASPVVRRRARELGVDLDTMQGRGSGGRVLLEDLERIAGIRAATPAGEEPAVVTRPVQTFRESSDADRQSRMRGAIAATVSGAWRDIPHFYVTMDVSMDNAEEIRRELHMAGSPVSVNDLVLKGVAIALAKFPDLNAAVTETEIVRKQEINLGIAVNVNGGLLVPVLKRAGSLSLVEMAERSRKLVESAREGRLTSDDMSGGSFSVSNLGPLGVSQFSAIILPPQVAILAVGAVNETVVLRSGEIVVGRVMKITLSADHRAVDGAYVAGFLQELKAVLENPVSLLI